jgi:glycosyltransferase involved in cell wall biosynthesis
LSVIVPTRGRPERLNDCLSSLARARPPAAGWEVVVIDDGSEVAVETLARPLASPQLNLRFVRQSGAGLNAARNRGAREARGELLAFLDDDTLVGPGWPRAIVDAFDATGADAVGGRVALCFEAATPRWLTAKLRRYLAEYDLGEDAREVDGEPVPVGANCAVRRDTFDRIGGFASGLDRIGASLVSNGDTEFFRRVRARGGRLVYEPRAVVEHCVPADRLTVAFFRRRAHAQGASDALLAATEGAGGSALREAWRAGRSVPIAARGLLAGRGATTAGFWLRYCAGRMSAVRASADQTRPLGAADEMTATAP